MFKVIVDNLGRYTAFRYRDVFVSIEDYYVVICDINWVEQNRFDLDCLK